jgi:hypothetical protein
MSGHEEAVLDELQDDDEQAARDAVEQNVAPRPTASLRRNLRRGAHKLDDTRRRSFIGVAEAGWLLRAGA